MKRLATVTCLVALAFIFFSSVPCAAQQQKDAEKNRLDHPGCKVYFTVYWENAHVPGGYVPGMHKEQRNWYEKTLVKKYPTVCMNGEKATYVIIWSSEFESQLFGGFAGGVGSVQELKTNHVYMSIFRLNRTAEAPIAPSDKPIYITHQESGWTYRAAHRKALEDSLKFLSSNAEK